MANAAMPQTEEKHSKPQIPPMMQTFRFAQNFATILLRGISQVFLLNNVITGVFFLSGVFYASWHMGVGTVIGALTGTLTALILKYSRNEINQGLYGYNSTLVCLAIFSFFGFTAPSIIAALLGSVLSTLITKVMRQRWKLPTYTAPFILSTWIVMFFIITFKIIPLQTAQFSHADGLEIIPAVSKGIGQVMFLEGVISGMLLFIGILVSSRIAAFYTLLGAVIGAVLAFLFSFPLNMINLGLFGFNGVLCGIALSREMWWKVIPAIAAIAVSVFMTCGIMNLGIIALTSPFVLSTWLVLWIGGKIKNK